MEVKSPVWVFPSEVPSFNTFLPKICTRSKTSMFPEPTEAHQHLNIHERIIKEAQQPQTHCASGTTTMPHFEVLLRMIANSNLDYCYENDEHWWKYMHLYRSNMAVSGLSWTVLFCVVVHYFTQCALIVFIVFAQCTTRSCWLLTATESWLHSQSDRVSTFASWMRDKLNQILPLSLDLILHRDAAGSTAVNKASLLLMTLWEPLDAAEPPGASNDL